MAKKKQLDEGIEKQMADLGNRLKQLRKDKGFTNHEQFAFTHNFGRAQYWRYENGEDMRVSTFLMILRALEISPEDFFSGGFDQSEGKK